MSKAKLALNRWIMGQVLTPSQFQAQQDALLHHMGVRSQLLGLPWYGVARLAWSDELIPQGALSISALTVVFASGELVDQPGNAVVSSLNLADVIDEGAVDVYLHVLAETRDARGLELYEGDARDVVRVIHRVELSTQPWLEDARQSMKLAELSRDAEGAWSLGAYVPPLVQVGAGAGPFLADVIEAQRRSLEQFELRLSTHAADALVSGERRAELRRAQIAAYRLRALLADYDSRICLHPYHLFSALRDFYAEVCLFQGVEPAMPPPGYDHDDLAATFGDLSRMIEQNMQVAPLVSPRLRFSRKDSRFVASPFPDELLRAREVYLMVQSASGDPPPLEGVKLASPGRLNLVHVNALAGVPFSRVASPGFSHTFGGGAEFYALERDDEWLAAVNEGALCFLARPHLADIKAALFWRV